MMSKFRARFNKLEKTFNNKKDVLVTPSADPVCSICLRCWYRANCIKNLLLGHKPTTCCIYQLFSKCDNPVSLEDVVAFVCENKCVERQNWKGDPVIHNATYCEQHCPMSRFILDIEPSDYDDVPHNLDSYDNICNV